MEILIFALTILIGIVMSIGSYYRGHTQGMIDREQMWIDAQVKAGIESPSVERRQ